MMDAPSLNLPDYCDFYKNLLVEELIFIKSPINLHYGKCAVIGKLILNDNKYFLQNISLKISDEIYRPPTGRNKILLLPTTNTRFFPVGTLIEVFGEAVLFEAGKDFDQNCLYIPKTSKDLVNKLRVKYMPQGENTKLLGTNEILCNDDRSSHVDINALQKDLDAIQSKYVPAIQVHTVHCVDQAEEVIACNLELRLVRWNRDNINT